MADEKSNDALMVLVRDKSAAAQKRIEAAKEILRRGWDAPPEEDHVKGVGWL